MAFADAPSQLLVDMDGKTRVDDPATTDNGMGVRTYDDLGVFEFQPAQVVASVTTQAITGVTLSSAVAAGSVTALGVPHLIQHGVVWDTEPNPTINDNKTTEGPASMVGSFSCSLTGLTPGTVYYLRAYATNEVGTVYGDQVTFTTLVPLYVPMISTN